MNQKEKSMLSLIKEYGFFYELKFQKKSFYANIPILKETWCLNSELSENHKKNIKIFLENQNPRQTTLFS
jgi:hypothetical protein